MIEIRPSFFKDSLILTLTTITVSLYHVIIVDLLTFHPESESGVI